jgi:uncharacterized membrane protein
MAVLSALLLPLFLARGALGVATPVPYTLNLNALGMETGAIGNGWSGRSWLDFNLIDWLLSLQAGLACRFFFFFFVSPSTS